MNAPAPTLTVLSLSERTQSEIRHLQRARAITGPARLRRDRGEPHPIEDFLFRYYPFPFSLLEEWHPPCGVAIEWPGGPGSLPPPCQSRYYIWEDAHVRLDPSLLTDKERARMWWTIDLLEKTAGRSPNFACHGLHEWAMVYQGAEVRHEKTLPLRLHRRDIDHIVASRPIACSHYDAFRFFAPEARSLNRLQPTLESRTSLEQPACIHANMDLYKWAAKSMPWIGSDLLLECFELAMDLRRLDMRASPYDVTPYGLQPVCIETTEGRTTYETEQRQLAQRAAPLRQRLIQQLRNTLHAASV